MSGQKFNDTEVKKWKYGDRSWWQGKTGTYSGGVWGRPQLLCVHFDDGSWDTIPSEEPTPALSDFVQNPQQLPYSSSALAPRRLQPSSVQRNQQQEWDGED